jgi:hypothetical protein
MIENTWIKECEHFFGNAIMSENKVKIKLIKETEDYVVYDWTNTTKENKDYSSTHYRALVVKKEEKIYCWGLNGNDIGFLHFRYAYKKGRKGTWDFITLDTKGFRNMKNPDKIMNLIRMEVI